MQKQREYELDYVDSMMIIDKNYNIVYTNRFSSRFGNKDQSTYENDYLGYNNKKYFDVYPQLSSKESTMIEALETGKIVVREGQTFTDMLGRVYTTNNITYPILRSGVIVGAMELSQDITSIGDLENSRKSIGKSNATQQQTKTQDCFTFDDIITQSEEMKNNIKRAKIYAEEDSPTLIYGETGTGKELFVEAMVNANVARKANYVTQNCAAFPETLFESILFGSVKGAFTGAENKMGLFELANNGVLFLDELNSMPLHLQAKLLRVLQDGKVRPVGSNKEIKVNVKVIIAMNKNPLNLMKEQLLREDLFYRLSSSTIYLTPLRERKEDIVLYIDYFLDEFNKKYHKNVTKLSSNLKKVLLKYHWPGNVREIRHVIESMVRHSEERIIRTNNMPAYLIESFEMNYSSETTTNSAVSPVPINASLKDILEKVEKEHILKTVTTCNGNVTRAAEILGMPRQTLKFRMDKLNISSKK